MAENGLAIWAWCGIGTEWKVKVMYFENNQNNFVIVTITNENGTNC